MLRQTVRLEQTARTCISTLTTIFERHESTIFAYETTPLILNQVRRFSNSIEENQHTVTVALTGPPNAGKSTLLNALVGYKVSAVSQKTNTTSRSRVGFYEKDHIQLVAYDTPGLVEIQQLADQKHGERVESAWNVAGSCDVSLLVIDAFRQYCRPDPRIVDLVGNYQNTLKTQGSNNVPKSALVLTKIDRLSIQDIDFSQMADDLLKISHMNTMFVVSGLRGNGMNNLRNFLIQQAQKSPWTIDSKSYNAHYESAIVQEIIREKLFRAYYKEVPYAVEIECPRIHKIQDSVYVRANIKASSSSMKTLIIGRKGAAISSVERAVQLELCKILKKNVLVNLSVTM